MIFREGIGPSHLGNPRCPFVGEVEVRERLFWQSPSTAIQSPFVIVRQRRNSREGNGRGDWFYGYRGGSLGDDSPLITEHIKLIFPIEFRIFGPQKPFEGLAGIAIVAFEEIFLVVEEEVSSSFVGLLLRISAKGATEIVRVSGLFVESSKIHPHQINILLFEPK